MKIPKEVKGLHKIRDAYILHLYLNKDFTLDEVGIKVGLTGSRCQQILYTNRHLINWDKAHEKAIRINAIKRLYKNHSDSMGKKSTIDILEQWRKEIEGDKPLLEQHFTKVDKVELIISDDTKIPLTQQARFNIPSEKELPI